MIKYSIVIPIFNEEKVLEKLREELTKTFSSLDGDYEFILVNDGSGDATPAILNKFCEENSHFKAIHLSRNFGQQAALVAGFDNVKGEAIIVMDADMQDPPELVFKFIEKWKEGYDVVFGIRIKRREWFGKRFTYWFFYRVLKILSSLEIPMDAGDFSSKDSKVVNVIRSLPERNVFIRGFRYWAGFKQYGVNYSRPKRFGGVSKYSLKKLFRLALDGIFSFSYVPLKLITWLGSIILMLSVIVFSGTLIIKGWVQNILVVTSVFFMGGVQLLVLGLLGEYLSRIYEEVKHRPLYIIKNKVGF